MTPDSKPDPLRPTAQDRGAQNAGARNTTAQGNGPQPLAQGAGRAGVGEVDLSFSETDLQPLQGGTGAQGTGTQGTGAQGTGAQESGAAPTPAPARAKSAANPAEARAPRPAPGPSQDVEAKPKAALPKPPRSEAEERHRARFLTFMRLFSGWMVLAALAYFMWTPGEWPTKLLIWVFLVILADEFGGWFGYLGLLLGGLGYLGPNTPPDQWLVILPLVGGALMALLLVKHSGGPLVLPFAGLLFAGTLLAVARYGQSFDGQLKLPADEVFLRSALLPMAVGLALSFVRQLVGLFLRRRARRRAERALVDAVPDTA